MTSTFAFLELSPGSIILLLIVGAVLFGRKLPEVGKYLGKGIVEFKKGLKGIEDEADTAHTPAAQRQQSDAVQIEQPRVPQRVTPTAPRFEDTPTTTPTQQTTATPQK